MGQFNSSLTRVQPVFTALYEGDPSGETWMMSLLEMARNRVHIALTEMKPNLGRLTEAPRFEFPVDPPKTYLKWLIDHPEKLSNPPENVWRKWTEGTQQMRSKFLLEDKEVQTKALRKLATCRSLPKRAWWRLEGVTYVDCALLSQSAVIFIEGKRMEKGPSREVLFYQQRNQIHRTLDCLATFAQEKDLQYFVIAVVEKNLLEQDAIRQKELDNVLSREAVAGSLPHLNAGEHEEIMRHYAGVTTWEDIVDRFGLHPELLD